MAGIGRASGSDRPSLSVSWCSALLAWARHGTPRVLRQFSRSLKLTRQRMPRATVLANGTGQPVNARGAKMPKSDLHPQNMRPRADRVNSVKLKEAAPRPLAEPSVRALARSAPHHMAGSQVAKGHRPRSRQSQRTPPARLSAAVTLTWGWNTEFPAT